MATHGGARPGAGRKSRETEEFQLVRRAMFEERLTPEKWGEIVDKAIDDAINGDPTVRWKAREWVGAYGMGAKPREALDVKHSGDVNLVVDWSNRTWHPGAQLTPPQVVDHEPATPPWARTNGHTNGHGG